MSELGQDPADLTARDHVARALELLGDAKSPRGRGRKRDGWQSRALRQIVGDLHRMLELGVPAQLPVLVEVVRIHDRLAKLARQLGEGRQSAQRALVELRAAERLLDQATERRRR